jgi:hypothetical protein
LTGVVRDNSGAVVSGAEIKLTDTRTGEEVKTKSNDLGVYTFTNLRPGAGYTLTVTRDGFRTLSITDISVGVNTVNTRNADLEVGAVTETVTVQAGGEATINTTDASVGNVIDSRRIKDLPISIRTTPARLLGLQPGVVANTGGGTNRDGAVTGSRTDQGNVTVDGLDVNDMAGGFAFTTVANATIDSVQEFRTVTSNADASQGRSSGGQVQLVTKSGTNEWHGSARYFLRHDKFAANQFFNKTSATNPVGRPKLRRHQFGGNFGGPIFKDTLFFFSDYEGRRDSSEFTNTARTTPLPHVYLGSVAYRNNSSAACATARLDTNPACITILTPAQVAARDPRGIGAAPAILTVLNDRYPTNCNTSLGDGINTCGFLFNSPNTLKDNTWTNRVDLVKGSHRVFGRFNIRRFNQDRTDGRIQQFPGDDKSTLGKLNDWAFAIGHTWNLSPTMINQATFGITKQDFQFIRSSRPSFPNQYTFGPLSSPFVPLSDQGRAVPVPVIKDDFTYIKGRHTFTFGGSFKPIHQNTNLTNDFNFVSVGIGGLTTNLGPAGSALRPPDVFNSGTATQNAQARSTYDSAFTFLLGRFASIATNFNYDPNGNPFVPGTGKFRKWRYNEYEFYFQDSWRLRNDLTLTAGVRWAYYSVPYEADGFQAANDVDITSLFHTRIMNGVNGVSGPDVEPFLRYDLIGKKNSQRGYSDPDLNNFAPRISLAYSPSFRDGFLGRIFGDRKTSIRAGAGVFYDRVSGAITFIQDQVSYIFDNSATTLLGQADPTAALLADPRFTGLGTLPFSNPAPTITRPFTPFVDGGFPLGNASGEFNYAVAQTFVTPYSFGFDFSIQRELPGNMLLDISYVGRQGRKLFGQADAAQVVDFIDPGSGQSMIAAFQAIQTQLTAGTPAASVTPQPWLENQIGPGRTVATATSAGTLLLRGDLADTLQFLFATSPLDFNIGLSSQFSTNLYQGNYTDSTYHGLLFSLRKRFSNGLQFDFNYTLSKSIDNSSSVVNTVTGGIVCDLRDLRACRGPSDFDARHVFNINWIYELPFGKGRTFGKSAPTWLDYVIGGWDISGILNARSGFAMSTSGSTFPVSFNSSSPAVLVAGGSQLDRHIGNIGTQLNFFADRTAAVNSFRFPLAGTAGNRNVLYGPRFFNIDMAILKNFKMPWSETHRLQFRAEAFNMLNNPSFNTPALNINSPSTFGQISSTASSAREIQFALRYDF